MGESMGESSTKVSLGQGLLHSTRTAMHVQSDGDRFGGGPQRKSCWIFLLMVVSTRLSAWQGAAYDTPRLNSATNNFRGFHHEKTVLYHLRPSPDWSL
jgi:hypothetical protein